MTRARRFYETVMETTLEQINNPGDTDIELWGFPGNMEHYGASGALVKMEGCPVGQNSTVVYFACEDCSVQESRVKKAGGTVFRSKMPIGEYGFIALVTDTEGNMIGLHSMQ